ncbi:MAG TPA: hypothetical protein VEG63_11360 [Candidatus Acidoferrales bacterium]|nr:hypothetical protein [Candidatus Acidoferrales bacterium]
MTESESQLDVRWPIGLLFAVLGFVVALYGLVAPPEAALPDGVRNLDLGWGFVMLLFGLLMIWGGWNAGRRRT